MAMACVRMLVLGACLSACVATMGAMTSSEEYIRFGVSPWADDYEMTGIQLGSGSAGHVYKAIHRVSGAEVAIKVSRDCQEARDEVDLLVKSQLQPGIVQIIAAYADRQHIPKEGDIMVKTPEMYVVLELLSGVAISRHGMSIDDAKTVLRPILNGILYLHRIGFEHGDLAYRHVMLRDRLNMSSAVLIDFDQCRQSEVSDHRRLYTAIPMIVGQRTFQLLNLPTVNEQSLYDGIVRTIHPDAALRHMARSLSTMQSPLLPLLRLASPADKNPQPSLPAAAVDDDDENINILLVGAKPKQLLRPRPDMKAEFLKGIVGAEGVLSPQVLPNGCGVAYKIALPDNKRKIRLIDVSNRIDLQFLETSLAANDDTAHRLISGIGGTIDAILMFMNGADMWETNPNNIAEMYEFAMRIAGPDRVEQIVALIGSKLDKQLLAGQWSRAKIARVFEFSDTSNVEHNLTMANVFNFAKMNREGSNGRDMIGVAGEYATALARANASFIAAQESSARLRRGIARMLNDMGHFKEDHVLKLLRAYSEQWAPLLPGRSLYQLELNLNQLEQGQMEVMSLNLGEAALKALEVQELSSTDGWMDGEKSGDRGLLNGGLCRDNARHEQCMISYADGSVEGTYNAPQPILTPKPTYLAADQAHQETTKPIATTVFCRAGINVEGGGSCQIHHCIPSMN